MRQKSDLCQHMKVCQIGEAEVDGELYVVHQCQFCRRLAYDKFSGEVIGESKVLEDQMVQTNSS